MTIKESSKLIYDGIRSIRYKAARNEILHALPRDIIIEVARNSGMTEDSRTLLTHQMISIISKKMNRIHKQE